MTICDSHSRPIQYLRVSVTDRCNLRCVYCMPSEGVPSRTHDDILRYEEIVFIVRAAAALGISKIRLTGGEPLARLGIVDLVRWLARIPGVDDLSMTTNGTLLAPLASDLAQAGLHRVNVSLDTLNPEQFRRITRRGELADVLDGIRAAEQAGLAPIKINTVVIRGLNDDQVVGLARATVERGWNVRFIEWMPISLGAGDHQDWQAGVVTAAEIRGQIEAAFGVLQPARLGDGSGPAKYFRIPGASGTIGFITPVSAHFCFQCNRLRLTADGQLRPCLLSSHELDLRTPLRAGAAPDRIQSLLVQAIEQKPLRHHLNEESDEVEPPAPLRQMSQIGG